MEIRKVILEDIPDMTRIKYVEASTGSLGHGFCTAVGSALALKIKKKKHSLLPHWRRRMS